jgi:hypothetical protein
MGREVWNIKKFVLGVVGYGSICDSAKLFQYSK